MTNWAASNHDPAQVLFFWSTHWILHKYFIVQRQLLVAQDSRADVDVKLWPNLLQWNIKSQILRIRNE